MTLTSSLQGLKHILVRGGRDERGTLRKRTATYRCAFVACLEAFENRTLLSTLTVANLDDSGVGSLRAAIAAANSGDNGAAAGGNLNTAGGSDAVFAGLGAGGGIFNYLGGYDSAGYGQFTTSVVNVTNSTLYHNQALGASVGSGEGGGIANVLSATTTLSSTILTLNQANGGIAGAGSRGGPFDDASSTLSLTKSLVNLNQANGAPGIGGGIYVLGTFTVDAGSSIVSNHASTSGNSIGP
jgi:hypothetical protein